MTNVDDTGRIPIPESASWTAHNSYRAQPPPPKPISLPDFTAGVAVGIDVTSMDCATNWTLKANLCNRGAIPAPAPIPGAFYSSDPRQPKAMSLCTTATTMALNPGDCETVSCVWNSPPSGMADLWFRADDDGKKAPFAAECHVGNDLLRESAATCTTID